MNTKPENLSKHSRMFNSIVLMGSGLALGCGGVARVNDNGAAGSSGASHGGAGSSAGGALNTAGAGGGLIIVGPSGGASAAGGAGGVGVGGGAGAPFDNPLPCPPAQWSCATEQTGCPIRGGFSLGSNCKCDLSRPARAADCASGQSFVCIQATRDAQGNALAGGAPYECSCRPNGNSCNAACDAAYGAARFDCYFGNTDDVLCECMTAVILK